MGLSVVNTLEIDEVNYRFCSADIICSQHNESNGGVRIIPCWLPTKSPWLNRIEPKWVHGKRAIVEPARLLTASELRQRVCDYFGCEQVELLPQKIA